MKRRCDSLLIKILKWFPKRIFVFLALLALLCVATQRSRAAEKPNIVLILADDLGYGDVSCYGATKAQTPNVDSVAKEGLRFLDAHSSSATCTPSRYALLTGEYPWRKEGTGILPGDATLIIKPGSTTLPEMLHRQGYKTGAVGKWHLGLGDKEINWNGEIKPGPLEVGFDYSFIMPATGDRVPCVFVENRRVVNLDVKDPIQVSFQRKVGSEPTGRENPELLTMHPSHGHDMTIVNGISRIGYMSGGKSARWVDEDLADTLTGKAVSFIEQNKAHPFFLYFATHDIHVPRVPHPRFAGKSGLGPRGDVILQFDWTVGEIVKTLRRLNLTDNTILIVTSDNGPVIDDGYKDQAREKLNGHRAAGPLRGGKYSAFEGGTRIPFILSWPGHVKPGTSDALICQIDFLASFADMTGYALKKEDGPDSLNILSSLLGKSKEGRDCVVEHAGVLALRKGEQKYIEPGKGPKKTKGTETETGNSPEGQFYDLKNDLGEKSNTSGQEAEKIKQYQAELDKLRKDGRSRP
jgi:arylsulfatase A-like enzyme